MTGQSRAVPLAGNPAGGIGESRRYALLVASARELCPPVGQMV